LKLLTRTTPLAIPLSLDQSFGPGEYGTFYPLATIDPGDILSGALTLYGENNNTASAIAQVSFNGSGTTLTQVFNTTPGAQSSSLMVNFAPNVTGLPPTLSNISSGPCFVSATSSYPDGAYYPAGTAAPVFGIAAIPETFRPARVSFSGELTRAHPDADPGSDFQSRNSSSSGTPDQFPTGGPPTVQQLAGLAQDAFEVSPHLTAKYQPVRSVQGDYGFGATVYKSEDGSQIVIAARGTSSANDKAAAYTTLADASFLAGTPTIPLVEEVKQLAGVVRQVANDIKPDGPLYTPVAGEGGVTGPQLSLTGYSLGGALAQVAGAGATFSPSPFSPQAPGSLTFTSKCRK
jgi:hypothetical protein